MRNRLTCVALVAIALSSFQQAIVGEQADSFRATVDLLRFDVVVLDEERKPIAGLARTDFLIRDGDRDRAPDAFASVDLPKARESGISPLSLESGVVTNERADEGRLVVVVFDRSIRAGADTVAARAVGRSVVDALGPSDLAAVVRSSGFSTEGVNQNFTTDKSRLRKTMDSPFLGFVQPGRPGEAYPPSGECLCGTCSLQTVERIANALRNEERRQKVIVFVGRDITIQEGPSGGSCSLQIKDARTRALRALSRSNVAVHVVDPSGLATLAATADGAPRGDVSAELARQANLSVLPAYTGGRLVANTNAPHEGVEAIFLETQSYYVLGLIPPGGSAPDVERDIQITVNRPGATVIARRLYFPDRQPQASASVRDVLAGSIQTLLPVNAIPLRLATTPLFLESGATAVHVILGVSGGQLTPPLSDERRRRLEVIVALFDARARPISSARQRVDVTVGVGSASADGGEWQSFFPAAPGSYELRLGVRDVDAGAAGSIFGFVDIPDPRDSPLAMSGPRLRSRTASDDAPLADSLLRRVFGVGDEAWVELQVFRRNSREAVSMTTRVSRIGGGEVFTSSSALGAFSSSGVANLSLPVPVGTLEPGAYLLTLEARQGTATVARDIAFEVVAPGSISAAAGATGTSRRPLPSPVPAPRR